MSEHHAVHRVHDPQMRKVCTCLGRAQELGCLRAAEEFSSSENNIFFLLSKFQLKGSEARLQDGSREVSPLRVNDVRADGGVCFLLRCICVGAFCCQEFEVFGYIDLRFVGEVYIYLGVKRDRLLSSI